jgi:hypothetical protein
MNVLPQPRAHAGRKVSRLVYVCARFPNGLSPRSYQKLIMRRPDLRGLGWQLKRRSVRRDDRATRPPAEPTRELRDAGVTPLTRA